MYRSKAEEEFADYLTESKIEFTYEDFRIPYVVSTHYNPDYFLKKYGFFIE